MIYWHFYDDMIYIYSDGLYDGVRHEAIEALYKTSDVINMGQRIGGGTCWSIWGIMMG